MEILSVNTLNVVNLESILSTKLRDIEWENIQCGRNLRKWNLRVGHIHCMCLNHSGEMYSVPVSTVRVNAQDLRVGQNDISCPYTLYVLKPFWRNLHCTGLNSSSEWPGSPGRAEWHFLSLYTRQKLVADTRVGQWAKGHFRHPKFIVLSGQGGTGPGIPYQGSVS